VNLALAERTMSGATSDIAFDAAEAIVGPVIRPTWINVYGMVTDRVVADKTVDSHILMDGLRMMTQLGVIPVEKAST